MDDIDDVEIIKEQLELDEYWANKFYEDYM